MDQQQNSSISEVLPSGSINPNAKFKAHWRLKSFPFNKALRQNRWNLSEGFKWGDKQYSDWDSAKTKIENELDKNVFNYQTELTIYGYDESVNRSCDINHLKVNGPRILRRKFFQTFDEFCRIDYQGFPKKVIIRVSNVP